MSKSNSPGSNSVQNASTKDKNASGSGPCGGTGCSTSTNTTSSSSSTSFLWGLFNSKSKSCETKCNELEEQQNKNTVNNPSSLISPHHSSSSSAITTTTNSSQSHSNGNSRNNGSATVTTHGSSSAHVSALSNLTSSPGPSSSFKELASEAIEPFLQLSPETIQLISSSALSIHARIKVIKELYESLGRFQITISDLDLLINHTLDAFQLPAGGETRLELGTDAIIHQLDGTNGSTEPSSPDSNGDASNSLCTEPPVYVASSGESACAVEMVAVDSADQINQQSHTSINSGGGHSIEVCTLRLDLLRLYARLVQKQFNNLPSVLRRLLFHVLSECTIGNLLTSTPAFGQLRDQLCIGSLQLLRALTNDGKTVICFRAEIDQFLMNWFNRLVEERSSHARQFFPLLTNVIRYNASAFTRQSLSSFIQNGSHLFRNAYEADLGTAPECALCLELFDILFRYSYLPTEMITPYTQTLCIAVCSVHLQDLGWRIMRNLLGSDLSYLIINRLITNIRTAVSDDRISLQIVAGSIFCLSHAMWSTAEGSKQVKYQRSFVLRVLADSLDYRSDEIALQTAIAMRLLLRIQLSRIKEQTPKVQESLLINSTSNNPLQTSSTSATLVNHSKAFTGAKDTTNLLEDINSFDLSIVFRELTWDILLKLCTQYDNLLGLGVRSSLELVSGEVSAGNGGCAEQLVKELEQLASLAEQVYLHRQFRSDEKLFLFLETFTTLQIREYHYNDELPDALVSRINLLIEQYEQQIHPSAEQWQNKVIRLMDLFFRQNRHTSSRVKVLKVLHNRIKLNRERDEEFLIEKVLLPQFWETELEGDLIVREQILKLVISLICECSSSSNLCTKLIEVIGRLLRKSFTRSRDSSGSSGRSSSSTTTTGAVINSNNNPDDDPSMLIVSGLILIFESKAYEKNFLTAIEAYKLLAHFAASHYCEGVHHDRLSMPLRLKIFQFLLSIQTSPEGFIGVVYPNRDSPPEFSRHLECKRFGQLLKTPSASHLSVSTSLSTVIANNVGNSALGNSSSSPSGNVTSNSTSSLTSLPSGNAAHFSFEDLFSLIQLVLCKERDWNLLRLVLESLPRLLINQNVVYSTNHAPIINGIFQACFCLYKDCAKNVSANQFVNLPRNARSSDVHTHIFPILTSLVAYRDCIAPGDQNAIVNCIHLGLNTRECTKQCIIGLTICLAELPDAMAKNLSAILSTLAKTSPNAQLAIAKLEFLSILNLWPTLYTSFVIEQFMSIFAIVLPYTSPHKFDMCCVALAYRVAAMWFLSSRFNFRKNLADYIMRQLPENVKMLRASSASKESLTLGEEYRKRSSSLNTENELINKREQSGRTNTATGNSNTVSSSVVSSVSGRISSDLSSNGLVGNLSTNVNSGSTGTGVNSGINTSNANLHGSPSLPSPALLQQGTQNVFSFNMPHDKSSSQVPPSPGGTSTSGRQPPLHSLSVGGSSMSSNTQPLTASSQASGQHGAADEMHMHQVEVFIDLLSRYVAGACSSLHNKDPLTNFLFENGHSATWLLGHKLITVTTSACSAKAVRGELCEKCYSRMHAFENRILKTTAGQSSCEDDVFNEQSVSLDSDATDTIAGVQSSFPTGSALSANTANNSFYTSRRRHQSAFTPTVATSVQRKPTSRDDSHLDTNSYLHRACSSWCPGWAEVQIRGPTGNSCWVMKLQNPLNSLTAAGNVLGSGTGGPNMVGLTALDLLPQYNLMAKSADLKDNVSATSESSSINSIASDSRSLNQNKLDQISESSTTSSQWQPSIRGRSNTISFMSSDMKRNELRLSGGWTRTAQDIDLKFGCKLLPNFLFLQFFHQGTFGCQQEIPVLLPKNELLDKSLRLFDLITPYETHRIGVVYVGKGQAKDRTAIFRNEFGSERYMNMIRRLGNLVRLEEIDPQKTFIGGLSQDGHDGQFACIHHENLVQAIFHVATFMPNRSSDPNCNDKNRHIGNNHVCIVYNNSQQSFQLSTLKGEGQWLKACIVITPLEHDINLIHIQTIPELKELIFYSSPVMISDHNMPLFVRQLSLSTNLISDVYHNKRPNSSSSLMNWVERIRKIKQIREKHHPQSAAIAASHHCTGSRCEFRSNMAGVNELGSPNSFPENFTNFI